MPPRTLQPSTLRAQLGSLAHQIREADSVAVAFHAGAWDGPETIQANDRTWRVKACRSALEVREALSVRANDQEALVILTELGHPELGSDVMARLVKRRVFQVDAWEPVLRAFGARRMDGRLNRVSWLADVLLDGTPPQGYPQLPSGTLDVTTAWRWAARALLGVDADEPDVRLLLGWTLNSSVLARWNALPVEKAAALVGWLERAIGPAAELPLALIRSGRGGDVVSIGLVCGALFADGDDPTGIAGAAAIRLERFTGAMPVTPTRGRALAAESERCVSELKAENAGAAQAVLSRADDLLRELGAESVSWRSRWLPRSFQQRLDRFAQALTTALAGPSSAGAIDAAFLALQQVRKHADAVKESERVVRAEHGLRLVRYLGVSTDAPASSFVSAVSDYASNHAFADIARYGLYASEAHQAFGLALAGVAERVAAYRDEMNLEFGRLGQGWFDAPSGAPGVVPIESVLSAVVAPLAAQMPVLMLVVDGMSVAVAESLAASIAKRHWSAIAGASAPDRLCVVPALPSVTEVCRTSLFCGTLRKGTATDERAGFAAHPALLARSRPGLPPVVFHKADLGAAAGLDAGVAAAISNREQRVVAAVVNAVDDHLLKDDMVRPMWTTDYVPVLGALCDAALAAGRGLVVTSDHGHVLDLKLTDRAEGSGADRYRTAPPAVRKGEVLVSGARVLTDSGNVVVAASERLRYTSKKNGYHGGISPQEMVVPLLQFSPQDSVPDGYREVAVVPPTWWELDVPVTQAVEVVAVPAKKTGLPLFDVAPEAPVVVQVAGEPAWLARLMASEMYKAQRQRAARAALSEDRVKTLLTGVAARGGRMTVDALAERLAMPAGRVTSVVAAAAQLLNFDGYQVLFVEGSEVVLNETLLVTQFELEG